MTVRGQKLRQPVLNRTTKYLTRNVRDFCEFIYPLCYLNGVIQGRDRWRADVNAVMDLQFL
jgi:hypothetical protein